MKILRIPLAIVLVAVAGRTFDANAQTLTILHQFPATADDGYYPEASLTRVGSTLYLSGIKIVKGTRVERSESLCKKLCSQPYR